MAKTQPKAAEKPKTETKNKDKKPKTESEEEEEESEDEGEPIRKPRTSAIIGFRTIQTTGGGLYFDCIWKLAVFFSYFLLTNC